MAKEKLIAYVYAQPELSFPGIPQREVPESEWLAMDVTEEVKKAALKQRIYIKEEREIEVIKEVKEVSDGK
mgnify:CR=1 FL=1